MKACSSLGFQGALILGFALMGFVHSCPPPGSQFRFPSGFLRNDSYDTELAKRWTGMKPGDGTNVENLDDKNHFGRVWPDGLITICFDPELDPQTQQDALIGLQQGWMLWRSMGLSILAWNLYFLPYEDCVNAGVTGPTMNYLWVTQNRAGGTVASSLGNINTGSTLDVNSNEYLRDASPQFGDNAYHIPLTYAHELGHVMGLLHEHQSPMAWSLMYGGVAQNNLFDFFCQNLETYAGCLQGLTLKAQSLGQSPFAAASTAQAQLNLMCHSMAETLNIGCGEFPLLDTVDLLPYPGGAQWVQFSYQVDLSSIMLYSSISFANAGKLSYTLPNNVYVGRQDAISYTFPPSALDVQGATFISPNPGPAIRYAPFYTPASPFNAVWNALNPSGVCYSNTVIKQKRREHLRRPAAETRVAIQRRMVL